MTFNGQAVCKGTILFKSTKYCVKLAGSGIPEDYSVTDCATTYVVKPGDSCAAIAAGASTHLSARRMVNQNTVTLLNGTVHSESRF